MVALHSRESTCCKVSNLTRLGQLFGPGSLDWSVEMGQIFDPGRLVTSLDGFDLLEQDDCVKDTGWERFCSIAVFLIHAWYDS